MRKNILFAAAGISLVLTGCKVHDHRYQMIPVDDPDAGSKPTAVVRRIEPAPAPSRTPAVLPQTTNTQEQVQKYKPMTGVVSSGGVDAATRKTTGKSDKKVTPAVKAENGIHVVRSGEFPEKIARKYGISTAVLLKANGLTLETAKKLRVGQKLTIPEPTARKNVVADKKTVQPSEKGKHRIKTGETPDVIARRYKIKLKDLMIANNLDDASARRLQVGQELIIPAKGQNASPAPVPSVVPEVNNKKEIVVEPRKETPVSPQKDLGIEDLSLVDQTALTVTEDTTYARLAAEYGVTEAGLRGINGGASSDVIPKGTIVMVPQK